MPWALSWPLLATSALGVILLAWALFLVLLVTGLALVARLGRANGPAVQPDRPFRGRNLRGVRDRRSGSDRRHGPGDRRVGLPDLRANPIERRQGPTDRRRGGDRRGGQGQRRRVGADRPS